MGPFLYGGRAGEREIDMFLMARDRESGLWAVASLGWLDSNKMRAHEQRSFSVHYKFSQAFECSAKDAYAWSADYRADDIERMGKRGARKIKRINEDTLVLDDNYINADGTKLTKRRLIRMYPELLTLINTRLSKDGIYSQFIYHFVDEPQGGSRLDFTGSQVFYGEERPSQPKLTQMSRKLAVDDAKIWKRLAKVMKEDMRTVGRR